MSKALSSSEYLKRNFISSLVIICAVIGASSLLVMMLSDSFNHWGIILTERQDTVFDTALMTMLSTLLLWLFSLRPLLLKIGRIQAQAEEQARLNSDLHSALDAHALVSIADIEGKIFYVNDKFCKISGYTQKELIGQDHRIVNSGYHDKDYIRNLWRTLARGHHWKGEFCNRSKNGALYWVDSTIVPLWGKDGKPCQYISILRNITVAKEHEAKLTALKLALDACSEMIFITDPQGYIQYANPALYLSAGWTGENFPGRRPNLLNSPNADQKILAEMQERLGCGEGWSGQLLNRRRNNSLSAKQAPASETPDYWAQINITPILNTDGTLVGYVQIQQDITEQIQREAELQIVQEDATARLHIAEALQLTQPLSQRFAHVLDILFELKGIDKQHKGGIFLKAPGEDYLDSFVLQGESGEEFMAGEKHIPVDADIWNSAFLSGKLFIAEQCFCNSCQRIQAHGHYIVPIAAGEDIFGILFLYTDSFPSQSDNRITLLREIGEKMALAVLREQAKAALESARDEAVHAALIKSEFLANMSHEIRTPMNGVLGILDILKDSKLSPEQSDLVQMAANSAEALLDIINDILDFSKLEAGKIEIEHIEFELPALVEDVCSLLAGRAHAKGLELNCFLPMNLPLRWQGDPTRIRQVLTNLIGNAVKFTDQGEISVKASMAESMEEKSGLRFSVKDTGIGISTEVQARLFQAFSQADSSTARRFGGTGLGLSISRSLVYLMGGEIGVESVLGFGTRFWFTLPLKPSNINTPPPLLDIAGKRALIVDDNATNRIILEHYLSHWGIAAKAVDNAPAALSELEAAVSNNRPFDILLSDLHMPGMDGLALIKAITERPAIAAIPRLLLTSGACGDNKTRSALGIAQSLLKPVRQSQLFNAISAAIQPSARQPLPASKTKTPLPDYSGKKILVVEDNQVNQKVILSLLAKFNLKPDLAENGRLALEQLKRQTYDLILMDCQMPVMDGYEATRLLRAREIVEGCSFRLPVVALTAHAVSGEREKCLSAGMDDYLSKPIVRNELAAALSRWLAEDAAGRPDASCHADAIPEKPAPIFWDKATALNRLEGDEELLAEMIALFLQDAPLRLSELNEALLQNNYLALADAAHAVKGMAVHFCAATVISLASELEQNARTHTNMAGLRLMTEQLSEATRNLIENLLQKQGQPYEQRI
ncbi:Histidine kinase [Candidatus Methylobacter favarea]|uniref:Sensory/regulatory protein RpfC n=1 Tax=Candidatus Methylobacter favarea TaxID=2707345 RepID=A0A8S0XQL5_9GAMM|nr:response regulator [Candidatus Methylobacter favarea]CAA9889407.1 Histidine kinase [Candidatus Methylobacter favarea]